MNDARRMLEQASDRRSYRKPQLKAFGEINKCTAGGIQTAIDTEPTLYYISVIG